MTIERILLTGAAGTIGTLLRPIIGELGLKVRLSDMVEPEGLRADEEFVQCDLRDREAVFSLVEGCQAILHFGGISTENNADLIHDVNIDGTYSLYEAARKFGVKRILFPSSNHVIGFHTRETKLDADSVLRPDSIYGVSKAYGEALARLYWDKFGIETAIVRIGSCFPAPKDRRMMATWMSDRDMLRLVDRIIKAPRMGCPVIYGVSDNPECWWDNSKVDYLGWRPQDSSAQFEGMFDDLPPEDPNDPKVIYQGGGFAAAGHFDD